MIRQIGAVCLGTLFVWACHAGEYEVALSQVQQRLRRLCVEEPKVTVWATGENAYVLSAPCQRKPAPGQDGEVRASTAIWLTFLCRDQKCNVLKVAGDWAQRARNAPPAVEPPPEPDEQAVTPSESGPISNKREAEIWDQIDARAAAILACANGETVVVQVEILPDRTKISLTGKHAGTPAEACVRTALKDLKSTDEEGEPLTVRHPVIAK